MKDMPPPPPPRTCVHGRLAPILAKAAIRLHAPLVKTSAAGAEAARLTVILLQAGGGNGGWWQARRVEAHIPNGRAECSTPLQVPYSLNHYKHSP